MHYTGWLLDASVDCKRDAYTLWVKTVEWVRGYAYYGFLPSLFVTPSSDHHHDMATLRELIEQHPLVRGTEIVRRFLTAYDQDMSPVLRVFTSPCALRRVADDIRRVTSATVYHADIDSVQQLFIEGGIFPFSRVRFDVDDTGIVTGIKCVDRREDVEYETPELRSIRLEVYASTTGVFPKTEDPVHHIEIIHNGESITVRGDDERTTLLQLQEVINDIDPDVIITHGGDEFLFHYLMLRAKVNGVQLTFSRDGTPLEITPREPVSFWQYNQVVYRAGNQVMFDGRLHIDQSESLYYSPLGMEGIIEAARLALVQPQKAARMSIGSINAAVQYYNAYQMGILIPPVKKNPEFLKTVNELASIDRGGLILQPRPDIYENVVECDFSSMYPTLMVNYNISPETICIRKHCERVENCIEIPDMPFKICRQRRGIVSKSLELVIEKRRRLKELIDEGRDVEKYSLMQNTLKGVLVSCFGYLGFKNARFGRVEAHTAVTALAREVLLRTQEIAEGMGLRTIHGIVDSVWLQSDGPPDYENIQEFCQRVSKTVGIDMSLKGVYRWMVIPSSRLYPSVAPLNRYYGVYLNGAIKARGIEIRRRDTCLYVGDCQRSMIAVLARAADRQEFIDAIPEAYAICEEFVERLYSGEVDIRDLILHARLTRNPDEYQMKSRAAIVARQLAAIGRAVHAGQRVHYVIVDADSRIPEDRVRVVELVDRSTRYDPQPYAELCWRAFRNLIPDQYLRTTELDLELPRTQATR
ncbi:MAG: DNA polymerase domain-containing protein [Candidatus Thorarchaeota archaeon]